MASLAVSSFLLLSSSIMLSVLIVAAESDPPNTLHWVIGIETVFGLATCGPRDIIPPGSQDICPPSKSLLGRRQPYGRQRGGVQPKSVCIVSQPTGLTLQLPATGSFNAIKGHPLMCLRKLWGTGKTLSSHLPPLVFRDWPILDPSGLNPVTMRLYYPDNDLCSTLRNPRSCFACCRTLPRYRWVSAADVLSVWRRVTRVLLYPMTDDCR